MIRFPIVSCSYEFKKQEVTRNVLQHIYESPSVREPKKLTPRQVRLKLVLNEVIDKAHTICEKGSKEECLWAWEVVDEIYDASSRAF